MQLLANACDLIFDRNEISTDIVEMRLRYGNAQELKCSGGHLPHAATFENATMTGDLSVVDSTRHSASPTADCRHDFECALCQFALDIRIKNYFDRLVRQTETTFEHVGGQLSSTGERYPLCIIENHCVRRKVREFPCIEHHVPRRIDEIQIDAEHR
ncbi:hypothetical protein B7759_00911 [Burkholderia glumae]|nr:hypothetical protein CG017_02150 [Burkholderia glumae]QTP32340.1 hypothetical protein B7759_00911 [Burkholderia glumae]